MSALNAQTTDDVMVALTELQRDALVLAGHHVPAVDAAFMLGVSSFEDVLDALDQATEALKASSYFAAYIRADALGLLTAANAPPIPPPLRYRRVNRDRSRGLRRRGTLTH